MVVFVGTVVFPIKCNLSTEGFRVLIELITSNDFTDATICLPFPFDAKKKRDKCTVDLTYYTSELKCI